MVNEKVALALISLLTVCVTAYKEITLAKVSAQKEGVLTQTNKCLPTEIIQ